MLRKRTVAFLNKYVLDFLFPIECIYCQAEGVLVCESCFSGLKFKYHAKCLGCQRHNILSSLCSRCQKKYILDEMMVAADYKQENVSQAIKLLKYKFLKDLSLYLGDFLSSFINYAEKETEIKNKDFVVIPIPLYWKRYNWRGFNQAEMIADRVAKNLNLTLNTQLKRNKNRTPQVKLARRKRRENLKNCFSWQGGEEIKNKNILLIDDVATTGSTLNEAARELKKSGAKKIIGLSIAGE